MKAQPRNGRNLCFDKAHHALELFGLIAFCEHELYGRSHGVVKHTAVGGQEISLTGSIGKFVLSLRDWGSDTS